MSALDIESVTKNFGGLTAVDQVSFTVDEGEIFGLIGPNGAGKTTMFNLIMGTLTPNRGQIRYQGRRIEGEPTHERVRRGLGRTYQTPKPFREFTIRENIIACMLPNTIAIGRRIDSFTNRAIEIEKRVGLEARSDERPDKLTPSELRRLEIAKALATDPDILLLDEVFAGITKDEAQGLATLIQTLQREGLTFLVVDHVMDILMPLVDRAVVLNFGQKIAEGTAEEVVNDETVREVYLGEASEVV